MTKTKSQNTHHILQDKKRPKQDKNDQKKSQKHTTIHSNIQYSDRYKSLHGPVQTKHTNTKTIPLII